MCIRDSTSPACPGVVAGEITGAAASALAEANRHATHSSQRLISITGGHPRQREIRIIGARLACVIGVRPVSYTHLDVYKRQVPKLVLQPLNLI